MRVTVYTWNIPEIYRFPIYDRYIPGIFHIYDTIQIPDAGKLELEIQNLLALYPSPSQLPSLRRSPGLRLGSQTRRVTHSTASGRTQTGVTQAQAHGVTVSLSRVSPPPAHRASGTGTVTGTRRLVASVSGLSGHWQLT